MLEPGQGVYGLDGELGYNSSFTAPTAVTRDLFRITRALTAGRAARVEWLD